MPTGDFPITYTSNVSASMPWGSVYIGDPPPYWNDFSTPYPGHYEYHPYQPWITQPAINIQTWYPPGTKETTTEDIQEIVRKALEQDRQKSKSKEGLMKVFDVLVIDRKECKVLQQKIVIAKDKETAMLDLDMDPALKEKIKKNEVEFIFTEKGSFTKLERKVRIEELKDEE